MAKVTNKQINKKIAKTFKASRKYPWDGKNFRESNQNQHICFAIIDTKYRNTYIGEAANAIIIAGFIRMLNQGVVEGRPQTFDQ